LITEVESGETKITRDVATTGEAAEGGEESIPARQYGSTLVLNLANESGKLLNVLPPSVLCLSPSWCEGKATPAIFSHLKKASSVYTTILSMYE